jgi:atypical dual specificity phosphatase
MPQTPESFGWVVPDVLAAMGQPRNPRSALEFLKDEGIDVLVSLTEIGLNPWIVTEFDFEYHHIPVMDFTAPSDRQIDEFVSIVQAARKAGKKTVVHCLAGRGRSGTMAACYLVSLGRSSQEALAEVRSLRPGSVESESQAEAVREYERRLRRA